MTWGIVLICLGVFIIICFLMSEESFGKYIFIPFILLWGILLLSVPFIMIYEGIKILQK
jgi:hypothetical protein